jgi:hypothetical protein
MDKFDLQNLIHTLLECALTCENCVAACLEEEKSDMSKCIELCRDSGDICFLVARLLQRKSEISLNFLPLCEEICRLSAEEAAKFSLVACQKCAEICIECADSCNENHNAISQN